ncbi:hypothetical protein GCM10009835_42000 [Planosporangium flavigriseum]|uniref:Uncharacterized protein n=1 Tax=Planosporangium flavigriseum TaxID=373681 RepID=A0A8J3LZL3_9ACTN|nr:hypothetical protein Pfl04_23690 [Planosporangium flavigriseum]
MLGDGAFEGFDSGVLGRYRDPDEAGGQVTGELIEFHGNRPPSALSSAFVTVVTGKCRGEGHATTRSAAAITASSWLEISIAISRDHRDRAERESCDGRPVGADHYQIVIFSGGLPTPPKRR